MTAELCSWDRDHVIHKAHKIFILRPFTGSWIASSPIASRVCLRLFLFLLLFSEGKAAQRSLQGSLAGQLAESTLGSAVTSWKDLGELRNVSVYQPPYQPSGSKKVPTALDLVRIN